MFNVIVRNNAAQQLVSPAAVISKTPLLTNHEIYANRARIPTPKAVRCKRCCAASSFPKLTQDTILSRFLIYSNLKYTRLVEGLIVNPPIITLHSCRQRDSDTALII